MNTRLNFEAQFPVPEGVFWREDLEQYEPEYPECEPDADLYHDKYLVWLTATKHAVADKLTVSQCPTSQYCKGWNDCVDAVVGKDVYE